jgi:hypothetical protein
LRVLHPSRTKAPILGEPIRLRVADRHPDVLAGERVLVPHALPACRSRPD